MSGSFSDIAGGVGSLIGAAGDVYGAFQDAPKAPNNTKPYVGTISTPNYTFGGGTLRRTNQDFLEGQRRLRGLLGTMREDVRPGFGRLTESGVNAIRQKAAEASGNLRAQMGRRGLAGASFADDQLSRVAQTYDQAENEFRNQAFIQEMQMTSDLIDKEAASLNNQAQHELTELGIATAFLNSVNQVGVTQAQIDKILSQEKLMAQFGQQQPGDPTKNPAATPPGGETPKPRPAGPRPTSPRPPQGTRPQQPFNLFGGLRP